MARTLRRRPLLSRLFTTNLLLVVVVMLTGIVSAVPLSFAEDSDGAQVSADATLTAEPSVEEVSPVGDDGPGEQPEAEKQAAAPKQDAVAESLPVEAPSEEAPMVVMTTVVDGTSGVGVTPDKLQGNPKCSDVCPTGDGKEFKIDRNPANKTYSVGSSGSIKIENSTGTGLDWSANGIAVNFVIVKAGPVAYVYDYSGLGGSTADTGLVSPINPKNGKRYGVSHVTFCYKVVKAKPALTLTKEASPTTYNAVGDEISYTYRLTNTGNVALFGPFPVTDDKVATSRVGIVPNPDVLAPGDHIDYESTYTITQADINAGSVTNIARGKGCYKGNAVFSNYACQTVNAVRNPELTLKKDASPTTYDAVGDEISYTYRLTNSGNVPLFGPFPVTDDKTVTTRLGPVPNPDVLAPGDYIDYEATYTITQEDLDEGSVTNTARGKGCYRGFAVFSNYDDKTVTAVRDPELTLEKDASPATYNAVGDEISYTYTLTNSGNVTLMGPFSVDDDKVTVTPVGVLPMVLAPGASIDFEAIYTITQADIDAGSVTNVAQGFGYFNQEPVESNFDDETVDAVQDPELTLEKEASPAFYDSVDDVITYTYTLTNSGNVTLSGPFTVEDDKTTTSRDGVVPDPDVLAPGDDITFTATYTITQEDIDAGSVTNVATGFGYFGEGQIESNEDEETVNADEFLGFSDLEVEKSADRTTAGPGDTITYTVEVTNLGSESVSDYVVEDTFNQSYLSVVDAAGGVVSSGKITWTFAEPLAAGATRTITYRMIVSQDMPDGTTRIDNVVVVSHPNDDNPDNDRSTWTVTVEEEPFLPFTEPFLPFTGADLLGLLALAGVAAMTGTALRRRSRKAA